MRGERRGNQQTERGGAFTSRQDLAETKHEISPRSDQDNQDKAKDAKIRRKRSGGTRDGVWTNIPARTLGILNFVTPQNLTDPARAVTSCTSHSALAGQEASAFKESPNQLSFGFRTRDITIELDRTGPETVNKRT